MVFDFGNQQNDLINGINKRFKFFFIQFVTDYYSTLWINLFAMNKTKKNSTTEQEFDLKESRKNKIKKKQNKSVNKIQK